jgi:hypothetical protein
MYENEGDLGPRFAVHLIALIEKAFLIIFFFRHFYLFWEKLPNPQTVTTQAVLVRLLIRLYFPLLVTIPCADNSGKNKDGAKILRTKYSDYNVVYHVAPWIPFSECLFLFLICIFVISLFPFPSQRTVFSHANDTSGMTPASSYSTTF